MQITVTIPDEIAEQAKVRGLTPESYVEGLVVEQKYWTATKGTSVSPEPSPSLSLDERMANLEKFFESFSANSENIPILPEEAYTRESFYSDHD